MADGTDDDNNDPVQEMLNEGAPPAPAIDYQKLFEATQAQNAALMQQNQQLAVTVQQVAARPVNQQPTNVPDPFAAFNPETKAALQAALDYQSKGFEQKLQQTQAQFAGMALEQEAASIAAIPNLTPDQITRAQAIFRGNRAKGIPIRGEECVDVVLGADFRAGKIAIGQRNAPAVINGGSRTQAPTTTRQPANFDKLSRKEQIKLYEADEALHEAPIKGIWDDADEA